MINIKSLAKIFVKRPRTVILLFVIFTILIGIQARNVYMESDFSKYLTQDDPTLQLWNEINEEFNIGDTIIIIVNQSGRAYNDIRDYEILSEMDEIYRVLYENPITDGQKTGISSIQSLAVLMRQENAKPKPEGNNDNSIPRDKDDIYTYMGRLTISSVKGVLYSNDFKYAVIIIQLEDDADFDSVLLKTQYAVENRGIKHAQMVITGTIAMGKAIQQDAMEDLGWIFLLSILFVSIVIIFFHRSFKGIIIGFVPTAFAIVLTFGTLGIFSPELTTISVAIIALLIGLGVDYSVHIMNRFAEEKYIDDKVERLEKILRSTGKAVLLSTITTMIGFGSLMISSMSPMASFGFGCAIGIFYAFISAIILVPCFSIILKYEKTGRVSSWIKFANFAVNNRKRMVFIALFFAVLSLLLIPQVTTDVNYFDLAPQDVPEMDALFEYSERFGEGGNFNAFLVETIPSGLEDPTVINAIYDMQIKMRTTGASVSSIADTLKEINDILDRNIIIEKFANLTDADNIIFDKIAKQGIVNKDHSKTIILVSIPVGKSISEIEQIVIQLNDIARTTNLPQNGQISELTGQDAVYVAVNAKLFDEQTSSLMISLILVLAVLILLFKSSVYGFLTIIPVCFVIMWEPGFLVATGISLSPITIVIASIMIGIGIDYGVHISYRVREEISKGYSKMDAAKIAIEKTGLSLMEAALTTTFGMSSIFFLGIASLSEFVIVIIFMVGVSYIAAALLLPMFYDNRFIK
jgi:hydrophobe/amphiphile efflux-3 (HAE3) family protein